MKGQPGDPVYQFYVCSIQNRPPSLLLTSISLFRPPFLVSGILGRTIYYSCGSYMFRVVSPLVTLENLTVIESRQELVLELVLKSSHVARRHSTNLSTMNRKIEHQPPHMCRCRSPDRAAIS